MNQPTDARDPLWIRILEFPLVALVIAATLVMTTYYGAYWLLLYSPPQSVAVAVFGEASLVIALIWVVYKLVISKLGDKPHDDLPLKGAMRALGEGVLIGTVLMTLIVGIAWATGGYYIIGPGDTSRLIPAFFLLAILPGFWEEVMFRGVAFRWLEEFGGSWFALVVSAAFFGYVHVGNPNATWASTIALMLAGGLMLASSYMATRSLWAPIGIHAAWNFVQGEVFDVPVSGVDIVGLVESAYGGPDWLSGGDFGLEASVITLVVTLVATLWLLRLAHRRGQIYPPMWKRDGAIQLPAGPLFLIGKSSAPAKD